MAGSNVSRRVIIRGWPVKSMGLGKTRRFLKAQVKGKNTYILKFSNNVKSELKDLYTKSSNNLALTKRPKTRLATLVMDAALNYGSELSGAMSLSSKSV